MALATRKVLQRLTDRPTSSESRICAVFRGALAPELVVPIYGPYRLPDEWSRWHRDPTLLERTRAALKSGEYQGIGEIHMIGGFISDWKNPFISGLFKLAAEFDVPVLVHTEFSRANYLIGFCQAHRQTRFLWAHAGSLLPPAEVARALGACPNVSAELSARDPWRHRGRRECQRELR